MYVGVVLVVHTGVEEDVIWVHFFGVRESSDETDIFGFFNFGDDWVQAV